MQLTEIMAQIVPADEAAARACLQRFDRVAKPLGSLGGLETLLARIAAAQGSADITLEKRAALVFCADNGVVAEGVAQSDAGVTTAIARSLAAGRASVSVMAAVAGCRVFPVDIGMRDTVAGLAAHKLMPGTANMAHGPAMPRRTAVAALEIGARLAMAKRSEGYCLLATGEAGIGNTTAASAVASVLLGLPAEQTTGRGAGLTDGGLARKRAVIQRAVARNRPDPTDPLDVLGKVGSLDIAAMAGAFLGAAAARVPVIIDGVISAVAALCAVRLCPPARGYLLPSHHSAEPAFALISRELALEPVVHASMRLGEGTGAMTLLPLLDLAHAVYTRAATFDEIAVAQYEKYTC